MNAQELRRDCDALHTGIQEFLRAGNAETARTYAVLLGRLINVLRGLIDAIEELEGKPHGK